MSVEKYQQNGILLTEEHPVDEALGCMVPLALTLLGISFFVLRFATF